jgi:streptogramin lyase
LDADFDEGTLLNVNHDAPNSDQLQLNETTAPFPFVNIAASGRGTLVRIDVNTGAILGEYLTAPDGMGRDPSRTTVDQQGNAWVANRAEYSFSVDQPRGSVARIGVIIGGTRSGQYLAPPFQYNTCIDRDGDGLIRTSSGLGNVLPWTNTDGADTDGGVSTADDECVINYTRVTGTGTRTVAVDANNDVWVGGIGDAEHEKLDGVTGQPVAGTQVYFGCGGYGGLVDKNGALWSARSLLYLDTSTLSGQCLGDGLGDYGLGIDPQTGDIWHTYLCCGNVCRIDATTQTLIGCYWHGDYYAQGVAVDDNNNVWVAHSLVSYYNTVGHLRTDGTFVGNVVLPGGYGPTGVAVDANGKVWVANYYTGNAMRIDPNAGPIGGGGFPTGEVDLTVDLGGDAYPYNYSDMTGFVAIGATSPQGSWTVVHDSGIAGNEWGTIIWNTEPEGSEPAGSSITVEARAAENQTDLSSQAFIPVSNDTPFSLMGQFIEVRATLKQPDPAGESPVLADLTVKSANLPPDCTAALPSLDAIRPPNHKFVAINIAGVTDPDGDPLTVTPTAVFQDEPVKGGSSGNTSPDATLNPLAVRAERNGSPKLPGNGRVYHISFIADDGQGGSCSGTAKVCVPHDQGKTSGCIDEGPLFDSLVP